MIGTLPIGLQLARRPSGIAEGLGDTPAELFGGNMVGAGEGGQQPISGEKLRRLEMQLPVATQRIDNSLARAGEWRWIENDHVIFLLSPRGGREELEDISPDHLDAHIVELGIGLDPGKVLFS